jgi:hypothetical protein
MFEHFNRVLSLTKALILEANNITTDKLPGEGFGNFQLTFVCDEHGFDFYYKAEIKAFEIEELKFLLSLLERNIGGVAS